MSKIMESNQEFNWEIFLDLMKDKQVVPVLGSDLILVRNIENNQIISLYDYMTVKLSKKLKLAAGNLSFREFILQNKNVSFLEKSIKTVYNEIIDESNFEVESLEKLARITDFDFFISTTFDNVFEKVLKKERCLPDDLTLEIPYTYPLQAFNSPIDNQEKPLVFKILGSITTHGCCAITEEEILESIYSLKNDSQIADLLYNSIDGKNLLFLGCSFPNWLLRFFIRIITNERFVISTTDKIIADNYTHKDSRLSLFLQKYKTQILHLSDERFRNPLELIDQLYGRWLSKQKENIAKRYDGSVFLSFSHKDIEQIRAVRNEMMANGINVWFDEKQLSSGDNYNRLIKQKIKDCEVFVMFISENSMANPKSFVYDIEWDLAISRRKVREDESESKSFIRPIILDDIHVSDDRIPDVIKRLTIEKLDVKRLIENIKSQLPKTIGHE